MTSHSPAPDWERLFPAAPHRWQMGLRPASAPAFFAREARAEVILAERKRWLDAEPGEYAAPLDEARPALGETARLAVEWGAAISGDDPLTGLARVWEPDFVLMIRGDNGVFRLACGAVCFPSSWSLREKLGRPMEEIHSPVPGLNAAMARQIHTFLDRLQSGTAWARENWGLSRDAELNHHPSRPRDRLDSTIREDEVWLRIERQLLFRLPTTGAVLFGIRVDTHPFASLPAYARAGLALGINTMPPAVLAYKGIADARNALLAMCSSVERRT